MCVTDWKVSQITQNKAFNSRGTTHRIHISKRPQLEIHHRNPEFRLPSSLIFSISLQQQLFSCISTGRLAARRRNPTALHEFPADGDPLVIIGITFLNPPSLRRNSIELCSMSTQLHRRRHEHKSWRSTFGILSRQTILSPRRYPKQTAAIHPVSSRSASTQRDNYQRVVSDPLRMNGSYSVSTTSTIYLPFLSPSSQISQMSIRLNGIDLLASSVSRWRSPGLLLHALSNLQFCRPTLVPPAQHLIPCRLVKRLPQMPFAYMDRMQLSGQLTSAVQCSVVSSDNLFITLY